MAAKHILVPTDFSSHAALALDYACELAAALGATVHLLSVESLTLADRALAPETIDLLLRQNRTAVDDLMGPRRARVSFGAPLVKAGDPRDVILEVAAAIPADLIVMGSHGRRGFKRLVLGSVAEAVLREATCPVLVVRSERQSADPGA